ncbi:hypothetical protein [Streptomyces malaysiensis]|uniref:Uncharacterized protein n=1 Tax=Streptomyces malaysiensis subsp. samsunensis TaxID=459658 RepID=A0A9X2RSE3_STRMQ|nr:hypothetical protein [Streptomyces samsunensis]MCQ8828598.1 hypothetical protein [Streptomyces samsunensis]
MSARGPKPAAVEAAASAAESSPAAGSSSAGPASLDLLDDLVRRCAALEDPAEQGEAMNRTDYLLLVLATILLPAALVLLGSSL